MLTRFRPLAAPLTAAFILSLFAPLAQHVGVSVVSTAQAATTAELTPTGEGNFTQWDNVGGSDKVDAVQTNDGDTSYAKDPSNSDKKQTFSFPGAGIPGDATVNSVTVYAVLKKRTGTTTTFKFLTENGTGGSNQWTGAEESATTSYETYSHSMTTNPDTGVAWTATDVNSWPVNFGIERTSSFDRINLTHIYVVVDYTTDTVIDTELTPDCEGNFTQWDNVGGSDKVDAVQVNDGDTSYAKDPSNSDKKQTFCFPSANVPADATVHSVTAHAVLKKRTGTTTTFKFLTENGTGGSNQWTGTEESATTSYEAYSHSMTTDPSTGSAWTVAEVNNWTLNFGLERTSSFDRINLTHFYLVVNYSVPTDATGGVHGVRYKRQQFVKRLNNLTNPNHVNAPVAPAGFGGPEFFASEQLDWTQLNAVCTVHDNLAELHNYDIVDYLAENFASSFGVSETFVADIITNGTYCDTVYEARAEEERLAAELLAKQEAEKHAELMALYYQYQPKTVDVAVGEDGYPVSTDMVWNACIRNLEVYLPGETKPVNCRRFHESHTWTHPDTHLTFDWSDRIMKRIKVQGYEVATYTVDTPDFLTADVRVVQRHHVVTKYVLPVAKYMAVKGSELLQQLVAEKPAQDTTIVLSEQTELTQ